MLFEKNSTLVMTGDSITDCGRARPVGEGDGLGSGYASLVNAILAAKFPKDKIKVLNTGISGNTVRHLKSRWQSDIIDLSPDYLSIMIGINDVWRKFDRPDMPEEHVPLAEYEAVYRELISQTKSKVRKIILITPFLSETDKNEPMAAMLLDYIAAVKKIAADESLLLVDMQAEIDKYLADGISPEIIAGDRVHPSVTGSMIIAKAFLRVCGVEI
jgi:lysophospholipase L1-like esterase